MDRLKLAVVSSGFLGLSPVAPGTVGTLGGVAIAWALSHTSAYLAWSLLAAAILYLVGRGLADWAERRAGRHDPGLFVVDEVVGYLVTVAWIDAPSLLSLVVAFFVFRFFGIFELPPARRLQRLGGGDGILLDDVVAGLYGLGVMALVRRFLFEPTAWTVAGG